MIKNILNWLLLPLLLTLVWLFMNQTAEPSQIALGFFLSLLVSWFSTSLRPVRSRPGKPRVMLRLFWHVVVDITRSNLAVFKIIWRKPRTHTPGFIRVPLDMTDSHGLAALASILTYTPGTVWAGYSIKSGILTLHVLDLDDEQHWIDLIKTRYERPLMEIFE
jgi:multicomponent K+:H+ antiporter subunit E